MRRIIVLTVVGVLAMGGVAWAGEEKASSHTAVLSDVQKEIMNILSRLKFQLADQTKFCRQFLKDFQAQTTIKYIKPIVTTNDYNDPALEEYKKKCQKFDLRKRVLINPRWADGFEKLPPDEMERYADVYVGTANFKLYKVDINNKSSDGDEFVFYREKFLHVSHLGEALDPDLGEEYDNRGDYLVMDFDDCRARYGAPVGDSSATATVKNYSDVIIYKNAHYVFDLFPSMGSETYSVELWGYSNKQRRLIPMCLIQPILPGSKAN
jgi:hypothetical protein